MGTMNDSEHDVAAVRNAEGSLVAALVLRLLLGWAAVVGTVRRVFR